LRWPIPDCKFRSSDPLMSGAPPKSARRFDQRVLHGGLSGAIDFLYPLGAEPHCSPLTVSVLDG
jgi:hypothetical protein